MSTTVDLKKHLGWSLTVGLIAGLWFFVSAKLELTPWTAFAGWSVYFFGGADMNACKKSFPCIVLGGVLGYATVYAIGALKTDLILSSVLVIILAFVMTYAPTISLFEMAPASFIGCAVFFGAQSLFDAVVLTSLGLVFGLISSEMARVINGFILPEEAEKKSPVQEAAL